MVADQLGTDDIDALASLSSDTWHVPDGGYASSFERCAAHGLVDRGSTRITIARGVRVTRPTYRRTPKGDAFVKALAKETPNV